MHRISFLVLLLSMVIVDSGNEKNFTTLLSTESIKHGAQSTRNKRGSNYRLDQSEIARQNQITQQIFANYLERRLFPYRGTSQNTPTIDEILPKQLTSTTRRPRPRGFATFSQEKLKRNKTGGERRNSNNSQPFRGSHRLHFVEGLGKEYLRDSNKNLQDEEIDSEGQESLQSVESEQHDQYYGDIFNRDPTENEVINVDEILGE